MRLNLSYHRIGTRSELSARLGVPQEALELVTLRPTTCKTDGCEYPAAQNNNNFCVDCSQSWYPRYKNSKGIVMKNCRGHGLFGPQFMRQYNGSTSPPSACCCSLPVCEEIGYSHDGMMCLPTDVSECEEALKVLNVPADRRAVILSGSRKFRVAPWHYDPRHRRRSQFDNKWMFPAVGARHVYRDADGKKFSFPPPNYSPKKFIENEIKFGFGDDVTMGEALPAWARKMAHLEIDLHVPDLVPRQAVATPTPSPNKRRKAPALSRKRRDSPESIEIQKLKGELEVEKKKLESALSHIDGLKATVEVLENDKIRIKLERDQLKEENAELRATIQDLEQRLKEKKYCLSYDDIKPGGILGKYVSDFTFFPDYACNDAFLEVLNYSEACDAGRGVCENLARYSKVNIDARKKYNEKLRDEKGGEGEGNNNEEENVEAEYEAAVSQLDFDDGDGNSGKEKQSAPWKPRKRKVSHKTEWLIYNFYVHANISMNRVAALFGIGQTLVHDIVYAWANVLCVALPKFFPVPTRSQMLRAYPVSVIRKFGHAIIFMLLDATEEHAETASMKTINSVLYSAYKHHSTFKWLVGCDPVGTVWDESISDGYPGSISDPVATAVSKILEQVPYGFAVEVDKGFLIENDCALLGILCIRPMKMLDKQTQQSKEDAALTQKVGKTRIPIEQANGQMKGATSFFDSRIRMSQIGLADLIFRSSYLMTNFKLGFIQERGDAERPAEGRPCKAEVRWYGATDEGLVDVRPNVELWGLEVEIKRWNELRDLADNKDLSDTDISELVLAEDWPTRMRTDLETKLKQ